MKRFLLLGLICVLIMGLTTGLYPVTVVAADDYTFSAGDGTPGDPYVVMTAEDMNHVRDKLGASYILGADIDLSSYSTGEGWEPIGTDASPFTGTFDGNDYLIRNLFINRDITYSGLFGYTQNATLQTIRLLEVDIDGRTTFSGSLVAIAKSTKIIGSSVSAMSAPGINNSLTSGAGTGGLVGYLTNNGASIKNSYAAINVSSARDAGGLLGYSEQSAEGIENSFASGIVTGRTNFAGGLVGTLRTNLNNSYALGSVNGVSNVGGLAGSTSLSAGTMINSSFQAGTVTGTEYVGQLFGHSAGINLVTDLIYNSSVNATLPEIGRMTNTVTGYQGISDEDMRTRAAYGTILDFDSVWGINEVVSYPYLRVFKPIVRMNTLTSSSYKQDSELVLDGFVMDGSIGEKIEVSYMIKNSADTLVASGSEVVFSVTEDIQTYSFSELLDGTRFPEGTYTIHMTAEDLEGHQAREQTATFIVDHTAPVITLNGANPLTHEVGTTFRDSGATAWDAGDGVLTDDIIASGTVDSSKIGDYTITYTVTDKLGNVATATRIVRVIRAYGYEVASDDARLAHLTVTGVGVTKQLTPAFTSEVTAYRLETNEEQIELTLKSTDPHAIVMVQQQSVEGNIILPLVEGDQTITITVQAMNGSLRHYQLNITRVVVKDSTDPVEETCQFTDIKGHWAEKDICQAASLKIVDGLSKTIFSPHQSVTRAELAVMLLRTLQISTQQQKSPYAFSDEASIPQWAHASIMTGVDQGMLNGYPDGSFRPLQVINRAEMAAMLAKALKWDGKQTAKLSFNDVEIIPAWALVYVDAVYSKGLIQGRNGNQFAPFGMTTRAEAAVVMLRLWQLLGQ